MENTKQYRIYIPTGLPTHLEAIIDHIPEGCTIELSDFTYEDGHKEGHIKFPNGESYSIDYY